jgi:tRNA pseudouridine55 synthase
MDGLLVVDKPVGPTSHDIVVRVRRALGERRIGHTGTLDPLASGLLPLCFGAATKFAQASLDADKRYLATLRLGVTTTSGDREGDVIRKVHDVAVERDALTRACELFVGEIDQVPPMHSALKRDGKPLYEYARAGIEVERVARRVRIHAIRVVEGEADLWTIDVECSKGTYIRTLGEDIGAALGCGAHLDALRRVTSGALDLAAASTLAQLDGLDEASLDALLLPPDALVAAWPRVVLSDDDAGRFLAGVRRRLELDDAPALRVYGRERGAFLGTGHVVGGELIASRLLSPAEVGDLVAARRQPSSVSESLSA